MDVQNGFIDYTECSLEKRCTVGTLLKYACEPGYAVSSPNTTCQNDHTWSVTPICTKSKRLILVISNNQYVFDYRSIWSVLPSAFVYTRRKEIEGKNSCFFVKNACVYNGHSCYTPGNGV